MEIPMTEPVWTVGDRVWLAKRPPYLKTADPMPMLRPPDLVPMQAMGTIVAEQPGGTWVVQFPQGKFLMDAAYLDHPPKTTS